MNKIDKKTQAFNIIVKGAGFAFFGIIFGKIFSYFFHLIIARLGSEQYGLISLGFAFFQAASVISLLGLRAGIIRYVSFYRGLNDERRIKGTITSSLKMIIPVAATLGLLMFFGSNYISNYFDPKLSFILKAFGLLLPLSVISQVFLMTMNAFQLNKYSVFIYDFLESLIKLVLLTLFIFIGWGLFGAVAAYIIGAVITLILSIIILEKKIFPIIKTKVKSISLKRKLIKYSFPLLLSGAMAMIIAWTDVLMIGFFRTTSETGMYNVTLIISTLLLVFPSSLNSLFFPTITKLYSTGNISDLKSVYQRTSKWIIISNFALFLLLIVFSTEVLRIFGKEYVPGTLALTILIGGYFFHSISFTSMNTINMTKKTQYIFWIYFVSATLNIIINYFLIPKIGVMGGAIATSTSFIVGGSLMIIYCYKLMKVQPFEKSYLKILIAGIGSIMVIIILKMFIPINIIKMITLSVLFIFIYVLLLWVLNVFNNEDKITFKAIYNKLKVTKIIK